MTEKKICDYCGKLLGDQSFGSVDDKGRRGSFCFESCRENGAKK